MEELEGLEYDELVLDQSVHKIVGKVTKLQDGKTAEIDIDEGSFWLVNGLGQLNDNAPDDIVSESIKNIIIVDKNKLAEFIKEKTK